MEWLDYMVTVHIKLLKIAKLFPKMIIIVLLEIFTCPSNISYLVILKNIGMVIKKWSTKDIKF